MIDVTGGWETVTGRTKQGKDPCKWMRLDHWGQIGCNSFMLDCNAGHWCLIRPLFLFCFVWEQVVGYAGHHTVLQSAKSSIAISGTSVCFCPRYNSAPRHCRALISNERMRTFDEIGHRKRCEEASPYDLDTSDLLSQITRPSNMRIGDYRLVSSPRSSSCFSLASRSAYRS